MGTRRLSNTAGAGFVTCLDCGGLHYGTGGTCPYKGLLPCTVCGDATAYACADCAIDSAGGDRPRVCERTACRDAHEAERHNSLQKARDD